jgi:hypothetical protein
MSDEKKPQADVSIVADLREGGVAMPGPVPVATQFVGWQPVIEPAGTPAPASDSATSGGNGSEPTQS